MIIMCSKAVDNANETSIKIDCVSGTLFWSHWLTALSLSLAERTRLRSMSELMPSSAISMISCVRRPCGRYLSPSSQGVGRRHSDVIIGQETGHPGHKTAACGHSGSVVASPSMARTLL